MCPSETVQITLYSGSTAGYVLSNGANYGYIDYRVDYDKAFNRLNYKYRKAMVRVHLSGIGNVAKSGVDNATGFLSLIGLGTPYAYSPDSYSGVVISDIQFSTSSQVSTLETGYYINIDTRNLQSVPMIPVPQGVQTLGIRFFQETNTDMGNAYLSPYVITISFTLFDEIEPQQVSMNAKGSILPLTG